ncbi:sensor domain-containing diguanylate cyclase [Myxococcota bacterium]|nr:sensor domain-containing diguanylate cyclase [Myxococcota bacterium]
MMIDSGVVITRSGGAEPMANRPASNDPAKRADGPFDELHRTGEHVMLFNEIAKALTSTLEPHEVLRVIVQQISTIVRPTSWSLILQDEQTGELYFEIAVGPGTERLRGLRMAPDEGIAGTAFSTGEAQIVTDASASGLHARRVDELTRVTTRNVIALPLRSRGRVLGVLELVNGLDRPMSREAFQSLKAIADYAAIAIENARNFRRVQELTIKDDHTGLHNARHLRERLQVEAERALRFQHPLSLVFLDLDRFKEINDTWGHPVGSALLAEVGTLLMSSIRKVDTAFRYGGDEFALLLVETDGHGARAVARRVRELIADHVFLRARGLAVRVTASIGIATLPDDVHSAAELLDLADQAMYRAKALGRNEVVGTGDLVDVGELDVPDDATPSEDPPGRCC